MCITKIIVMGAVVTVWLEKSWICYIQLKMDKDEGHRTRESVDESFFYQTLILNPYGCICEIKPESDFLSWMLIKLDKI